MSSFVSTLARLDKTQLALAGGKAANLGELSAIKGIKVPEGFCVTTEAYRKVIDTPQVQQLLDELRSADDHQQLKGISKQIRDTVEAIVIPDEIVAAINEQLTVGKAYAIRSSATAEDLPSASFAGQQDTYLNIIGKDEIIRHVSRCWASLFTERAVIYRNQNGFDHRKVQLAVIIQQMVMPQVAGTMFTADPVTGNRKVLSIDASFGLGEALVSGLVNADNFKVREGRIIDKKISKKTMAVNPLKDGGTAANQIPTLQQNLPSLSDGQVLQLEQAGRTIEAHFGSPQDIEWCIQDDQLYIVQSRPITTLFPVPIVNDDQKHVYISVGHQQMMTDVMLPLGISFRQLITPRPMYAAGGRMFVDIAQALAIPALQKTMINTMGQFDLLIKDALVTLLDRNDFIQVKQEDAGKEKVISTEGYRNKLKNEPAIAEQLIKKCEAEAVALKQKLKGQSGTTLLDVIREDLHLLVKTTGDPQSMTLILAAMDASVWLNEKMKEWLGEKNVADILTQSAPNNITSEMGLELLQVADMIRPYAAVITYLQETKDDNFLAVLPAIEGGVAARDAIEGYLDKYGMRCTGEIDITRTRWSEKPLTLVPLILSNLRNLPPGEGYRRFEQGLKQSLNKEREILARLARLPDAEQKIEETKRMIGLVRTFAGYREYPKYHLVHCYFIYKQALLQEADRLVKANVLKNKRDIYYLNYEELYEVVRTQQLNYQLIDERKQEYKNYEKLTPPRIMTSEGEVINGRYNREGVPPDALAGLAVSSGIIEGRARVIINMEEADLEEGDILVTAFTDPSWTPLFVLIKGLVTEVGGLMTHGSVIAREYGLPAVVGVEHATQLIKDGQRIRVNGTEGWVELL
ncbi:MAG: phosphoenolpyruvate synthase [Terrimonas ferruginea]|uniref:phosphoenolpyruvate synthase n=1 Tax=Terrimonas ferruginea TaxID=249 RepID=UPI00092C59B3|nr:phosphoenolpyruvate synthase [Terrimonas ferruginea]MBN8782156.1 phosphoenolpyruvate synthase [Terrimonas ferruginea]OJW42694.1 MAG: phosphoenolpyruvate synthase [Sphingobacteriales bacterium 48-107]